MKGTTVAPSSQLAAGRVMRTAVLVVLVAVVLTVAFAPARAQTPTPAPTQMPTPTPLPDLVVDGRRVLLAGDQAFRNVTVVNRGRIEIRPFDGSGGAGRIDITAERIEIDRTSTILGDVAGYRGRPDGDGEGPGGGEGGARSVDGGGGGGHGGRGGDGVLDTVPQPAARGGDAYGADCSREIDRGSAGGAPGIADGVGGGDAAGGHGGGALALRADVVVIAGTVSLDGGDGIVDANDAAGGGAGGGVLVIARQLTQTGRIHADGGDGGVTDDGGGGGGGGRIKLLYVSGTVTRRYLSVEGGKGDGNGYANDGQRGSICIQLIPATETPTPTATTTPTETATPTPVSTATPTVTDTPVATDTPTATPTSTPTDTPTPTATATATPTPAERYIPLALRERCREVERAPVALALVLDASTSMGDLTRAGRTKLAAALDALRVPIGMLGIADDVIAIVAFNDRAEVLAPLSADRVVLLGGLAHVTVRRGSRLDAGVALAVAELAAASRRHVRRMVVVTDGRCNPTTPAEALRAADAARRAGIVVDTVGLGVDADAALLSGMASGGDHYHDAPDAEALARLFADLAWVPPPCGGAVTWPGRAFAR